MRRTRRAVPAALAALLLSVTACGASEAEPGVEPQPTAVASPTTSPEGEATESTEPSEPSEPSSETPEPEGPTVQVRIDGDRVEPNGRRVEVGVGEPLTLTVRSDRAAELHVHATPEQVLEVRKGRSTLKLVIERPGVVDVEEHDSGIVVFQVQVS